MDMKLEVVIVPVSDVDRARRFYEQLGWRLDADYASGTDFRVVQFTPPGSGASIYLREGHHHVCAGIAPGSLPRRSSTSRRRAPTSWAVMSRCPRSSTTAPVACSITPAPPRGLAGRIRNGRVMRPFAAFSDSDGNGWFTPGSPAAPARTLTGAPTNKTMGQTTHGTRPDSDPAGSSQARLPGARAAREGDGEGRPRLAAVVRRAHDSHVARGRLSRSSPRARLSPKSVNRRSAPLAGCPRAQSAPAAPVQRIGDAGARQDMECVVRRLTCRRVSRAGP